MVGSVVSALGLLQPLFEMRQPFQDNFSFCGEQLFLPMLPLVVRGLPVLTDELLQALIDLLLRVRF